jgi:hypothetical protein
VSREVFYVGPFSITQDVQAVELDSDAIDASGSVTLSHSWEEASEGGPLDEVPVFSSRLLCFSPAAEPVAVEGESLTSRLIRSMTIWNISSGSVFSKIITS